MSKLKHAEKTFLLRGLLFQVRNELKLGWPEEAYHQAFVSLLKQKGIPVLSKPRHDLLHRGVVVHTFEADVIAWDLIVLELKALAFEKQFSGAHFAQLIHYLKYYGKDLGLLVNFMATPIAIKRVLWDEPELFIAENYGEIQSLLSELDKPLLR
ncbi:MAG: GxxExxY protein [Caldilineaceae bacterium]